MKHTLFRTLKIVAVLIPLLCVALFPTLNNEDDIKRIKGFYLEEEDSLDVVLLGASELFSDFSSGLAYEEFGFTSYPCAVSANHVELFPCQLEEVYRTQDPQMIVIDINGALYVELPANSDGILRKYVEGMPLCRNKIRMIRQFGDPDNQLSYYFPNILYRQDMDLRHIRQAWENDRMLYDRGYSLLKGNVTWVTSRPPEAEFPIDRETPARELTPEMERKLLNFLNYCREQGYDNLLFLNSPHQISSQESFERFQMSQTAGDMIRSFGYDFRNLEYEAEAMGLDPLVDFYDSDHLNPFGQVKYTRYLSRILTEEYGVTPRPQTPENRARWEHSVQYFHLYNDYFQTLVANGNNDWLSENKTVISILDARAAREQK